ncbi:MAG: ParB/RepB/Spo0J family partition protein [bacterium]
MTDEIKTISIDMIDDPEIAMRSNIQDPDIDTLAQSIKEHGLLEPLVVRPNGDRYELIAGHRRLTACKMISKIMIPCTIRDVDANSPLLLRIQENTHRLDVNPVDDAIYIYKMIEQLGISVDELAQKMKRTKRYIEDRLSILDMPDVLIKAVGTKSIGIRAAQSMMKITDEPYRDSLISIAVKDGVSADTADRWFKMWELNQLPEMPTKENLQEAVEGQAPPERAIQCAKCLQSGLVRDMLTVWIHKRCPDHE